MIMRFYEVLTELMVKHKLKGVQIYDKLGIKKSYFSKIKNGSILPPDFLMVLALCNTMGLDELEREQMSITYQNEKISTKYGLASAAFHQLYRIGFPALSGCTPFSPMPEAVIQGSEMVKRAFLSVVQQAQSVKLLMTPLCCENLLIDVFAALPEELCVEWIMPLDKTEVGAERNMASFISALPALFLHCGSVRGMYTDLEDLMHMSVFCYWCITNHGVLLLSNDCCKAQYLNTPDIIALYLSQFEELQRQTFLFMNVFDNAESFLRLTSTISPDTTPDNRNEIYILKNAPCILMERPKDDFFRYVADIDNSTEIIEMYYNFLVNCSLKKKVKVTFTEQGLYDFIHSDVFYETSKHLSKNIPKEMRLLSLYDMIENAEIDNSITPHIMRLPDYGKGSLYLMNLFTSGRIILLYDFGKQYRIADVNDSKITNFLISYQEALQNAEFISDEKSAIDMIKKELEVVCVNEKKEAPGN